MREACQTGCPRVPEEGSREGVAHAGCPRAKARWWESTGCLAGGMGEPRVSHAGSWRGSVGRGLEGRFWKADEELREGFPCS